MAKSIKDALYAQVIDDMKPKKIKTSDKLVAQHLTQKAIRNMENGVERKLKLDKARQKSAKKLNKSLKKAKGPGAAHLLEIQKSARKSVKDSDEILRRLQAIQAKQVESFDKYYKD